MLCPYCGAHAHKESTGNDGCEMFIAEDTGSSTECYDADVSLFVCDASKRHFFYADDLTGNKNQIVANKKYLLTSE